MTTACNTHTSAKYFSSLDKKPLGFFYNTIRHTLKQQKTRQSYKTLISPGTSGALIRFTEYSSLNARFNTHAMIMAQERQ